MSFLLPVNITEQQPQMVNLLFSEDEPVKSSCEMRAHKNECVSLCMPIIHLALKCSSFDVFWIFLDVFVYLVSAVGPS